MLHEFIRDRIDSALGVRSWTWLARNAGIPQSTLATQKAIPKFSIATLVAVSEALGRPVSYFLPPGHSDSDVGDPDIIDELEEMVRRLKAK